MSQNYTPTVGLVGVGALGSAVASRIAGAGFELLIYDCDGDRAGAVAEAVGARAIAAPAGLSDASVVVLLLPDSSAVEGVVLGDDGLLTLLRPGSFVLDMGSSDPRSTVAIAQTASEAGLEYVDSPVSGGVSRARAGDLAIMFGGSASQLELLRPLLRTVGSTVVETGAVGSAHAMKALNNLLSAIGLVGALEVVEVGRRFGLDPRAMLDVLNRSSGKNNATEAKIAQYVLNETYSAGFALRLMLKDVRTAISLARELDAATPLGDACLEIWAAAADVLPPDADHTQVGAVLDSGALEAPAREGT
jgi:3-hydroxyisobutyrate dehydrogenase